MPAVIVVWTPARGFCREHSLTNFCPSGALLYWEWGYDTVNPSASPVFDGSDTSLGGNGAPVPHQGLQLQQPFSSVVIALPPGARAAGACRRGNLPTGR